MAELFPKAAAERALAVAIEAAEEAGGILLQHFGKLDPAAIGTKSTPRDLVTAADLESERAIVARLRAAFPEHAIEAEEEVRDAHVDERPRWFLDPLDGTVNFVHRLPVFAVSLALWWRGAPQAAVVHVPLLRETFSARAGGGAFLGREPIRVSTTATLGDAILATGFPYRRGAGLADNLDNVNRFYRDVRDLRRMGSAAVDLAYVAAGRLDGFWELSLAPHDVAAGGLLVREAGGVVHDADGGEDWLRGGHIVATNSALFEAVRARVTHG
ncbi:MAG: inositol monophosphatase [Planctomycetes bacterium]|nr:inositol monophosphatase [Planctomycetota bacterium]